MTPREAFKFGFLCRCVEEGLDPYQTQARIQTALEKRAEGGVWDAALKALQAAGGVGKATGELALKGFPVSALVGGVGGAAIGSGLAQLGRRELDEDEIRRQELIDTYNLFADRALEKARPRQALTV